MKQSWTIGILCYNEAVTIVDVYSKVKTVLSQLTGDSEIIIVDDGSTDGSIELIKKIYTYDPSVRLIFHEINKGIGASIRDVYFNATKQNVVFVPGDGQFDEMELIPFAEFSADHFICFFRHENETYSLFRNALSWANKMFNSWFLGFNLKDVNWVKVYKREILYKLELKSKSSIIESEICAKLTALGKTAVEVPSVYHPRIAGQSKGASFGTILKVYKELWAVYLLVKKFKKSSRK